ncbi:hypothetical protein FB451DRAFT_1196248 [Mycena latifolia]|nr:hypothetical protein FB451DRAFT_1196248 [Mycena latifolia]
MGARSVGTRESREEAKAYKPKYRPTFQNVWRTNWLKIENPQARERKNLRAREQRAAKKEAKALEKRRWDPPKKEKEATPVEVESEDEAPAEYAAGVGDQKAQTPTFRRVLTVSGRDLCSHASEDENLEGEWEYPLSTGSGDHTPTLSELEHNTRRPTSATASVEENEQMASEVLTSMLLARQRQTQDESQTAGVTTPQRWTSLERAAPPTLSPLPPSSPLPESPEPSVHRRQGIPPRKGGWVLPGEWDDPGSPLPSSAYDRMLWPRLFRRFFGPKGDSEPDAEEQKVFFSKDRMGMNLLKEGQDAEAEDKAAKHLGVFWTLDSNGGITSDEGTESPNISPREARWDLGPGLCRVGDRVGWRWTWTWVEL